MSEELRCLAVRQPWAWAIITGAKDIENRSWTTTYRGPVAILASVSKTEVNQRMKAHGLPPLKFTFGALIGVADLLDVEPLTEALEANPWAMGEYCWKFGNARAFREPIPLKGRLNLYTLEPNVAEQARVAIASPMPVDHDADVKAWLADLMRRDPEERSEGHLESYFALNDGAGALRLASAAFAREASADRLTDVARARLTGGDLTGALRDATAAIELDPKNGRAFFVRGLVYECLGGNDKVTAAELDPRFADEEHPAVEDDGAEDA